MTLDHGLAMYQGHGCRCDVCRSAATEARTRVKVLKRLRRIEQDVAELADELELEWWEADLELEARKAAELTAIRRRRKR